jgi:hypothetical protein
MANNPPKRDEAEELKLRLDDLLEQSLGLNVFPKISSNYLLGWKIRLPRGPLSAGLAMAGFYLLAFFLLPWILFDRMSDESPSLEAALIFQLYGAVWSGWAAATTRIASRSVFSALTKEVIPRLSGAPTDWISGQLATPPYLRSRLLFASWAIGLFAAVIATSLLSYDIPMLPFRFLIWWAAGWALLYATAAKVVLVSRFYGLFAEALSRNSSDLYPLCPNRSPLVVELTIVSRRMLLFWFGIMLSIALIIPFNLLAASRFNFFFVGIGIFGGANRMAIGTSRFVIAHLVGTAVFSIGVGTFVFLRSEAALRRAVRSAANAQLQPIENEVNALLANGFDIDLAKRLSELNALHADVAAGGSYRAAVIGGVSLILPFIPLILLILKLIFGAP